MIERKVVCMHAVPQSISKFRYVSKKHFENIEYGSVAFVLHNA